MKVDLLDGSNCQVKAVEEIEALGVMLDRQGSTARSIEHRFAKAERLYGRMSSLLSSRRAPLQEKLRAWASGAVGSALHGCGGWYLLQSHLHTIRRWECGHVRRFLRLRRGDEESMMAYNRRTNLRFSASGAGDRSLALSLLRIKESIPLRPHS